MADLATPEAAVREAARRIDAEIHLTLKESAKLRAKYAEAVGLQEKIDRYRDEGRRVPISWITNPFHRRYYVEKGWAG
jgi:hypothetical protein